MVETAKRILTKEKIDRQFSGQALSNPFMSIKNNHNRKVSFDTWDELGDKMDKLTVMIGRLTAKDRESGRQFKPQIYQSRRRGQNRESDDRCNYDQRDYQSGYRSDSGDRRNQYRQNFRGRSSMNKTRGGYVRGNARVYQNFERQNGRRECRNNYRDEGYSRSRDRSRSRERSFPRNFNSRRNNRSMSNSRSKSGSRASTNRDRIRCYKCRECNHFLMDYPPSEEQKELQQLQEMLNLDEEQMSIQTNAYDSLNKITSLKDLRQDHLYL